MKWQKHHTSLAIIIAGFAVLYLLLHKQWLLAPVFICILGFIFGRFGIIIHEAWMKLAKALGFINSRILLTILFFLILTPVAFFMRLFGKGSFIKSSKETTVFNARNHLYTKSDLQHPF